MSNNVRRYRIIACNGLRTVPIKNHDIIELEEIKEEQKEELAKVFGVNLKWEIKHHPTDLSNVMKSEDCRFIGSPAECVDFIEKYKPKEEFVWTDELVSEFLFGLKDLGNLQERVSKFKSFKQSKSSSLPKQENVLMKEKTMYDVFQESRSKPQPSIQSNKEKVTVEGTPAFDSDRLYERYLELLRNPPKYTEKELLDAEEKAFNAGGRRDFGKDPIGKCEYYDGDYNEIYPMKYKTFSDYKNSKP